MKAGSRGLVLAALLTLGVVGAVLDGGSGRGPSGPTPARTEAARPRATPAVGERRFPRDDETSAAALVAEAYTLAAINWTAATYREAQSHLAELAAGRLRRDLSREPSVAQLEQLRIDRVVRLGAVRNTRMTHATQTSAAVRVEVDELQVDAGRRVQRTVAYRVGVVRASRGWRVTAFGATHIGDGS